MTKIYVITGDKQTGKTTQAMSIIKDTCSIKKVLYINEGLNEERTEYLIDRFGIVERQNIVFDNKLPSNKVLKYFDLVVFDDYNVENVDLSEFYVVRHTFDTALDALKKEQLSKSALIMKFTDRQVKLEIENMELKEKNEKLENSCKELNKQLGLPIVINNCECGFNEDSARSIVKNLEPYLEENILNIIQNYDKLKSIGGGEYPLIRALEEFKLHRGL